MKVADLGLARLNAESGTGQTSLTQAGGVVGTVVMLKPFDLERLARTVASVVGG